MIVAGQKQRFQSGNLLGPHSLDEVFVRPFSGACACGQGNLFQSNGGWKQNVLGAQMSNHRGDNGITAIRACCFFKCSIGNGSIIPAPKGAKAKVVLQFPEMLTARFFSAGILVQDFRFNAELLTDEGKNVSGRYFADANHAAGKFQIRKVHGKPQPICVPASLPDQRHFLRREHVVPDDRRRVRRRIKQRCARLRRKNFVFLHGRPLVAQMIVCASIRDWLEMACFCIAEIYCNEKHECNRIVQSC